MLATTAEKEPASEWDHEGLAMKLRQLFGRDLNGDKNDDKSQDDLYARLKTAVMNFHEEREKTCGPERLRMAERFVVLWILDKYWKEHLYALDNLREGIGLRGYGQKDPLVEFKRESFEMFEQMLDGMKTEMVQLLFRLTEVEGGAEAGGPTARPVGPAPPTRRNLTYGRSFVSPAGSAGPRPSEEPPERFGGANRPPPKLAPRVASDMDRVGRNDPCPCGSGKKFKHCCGRKAA